MESTQLIKTASSYDINNMTFSKVQVQKIGDTGMTCKRINIGTKNPDGSEGELVFETQRLFSFGVCENIDQKTNALNGYTMPICLHSKDGASDEEKAFTDKFDAIIEKCKDYMLENKKELKMNDLERSDLRKLNPIYVKKDADGEPVEGASPTLYAKLIVSKKHGQNKIMTEFFDAASGEQYNALDLIGKYCHVRAVIKIESLFLGSLKTSLQIKLYEAEVSLVNSGVKRLLSRPAVSHTVKVISDDKVSNPMAVADDDDDMSDLGDDDVKLEDSIKVLTPPPAPKKKVVVRKKKPSE
jgi:hypothetical protein